MTTSKRRDEFDPDQPRDENGRWAGGGGGFTANVGKAEHMKSLGRAGYSVKTFRGQEVAHYHPEQGRSKMLPLGSFKTRQEAKAAAHVHEEKVRAERIAQRSAESARIEARATARHGAIQQGTPAGKALVASGYLERQAEAAARGTAYVREMESRRAAITGNIKPPAGDEPSREERRAALTGRDTRGERAAALLAERDRERAQPTKTYDPTKPYGTTEETRSNGGRSYKVQVQNKAEPLRFRGKTPREKEEQHQKDLARMRERQAARAAGTKTEAQRIAEYRQAWTDPNEGKDYHARREALLGLGGTPRSGKRDAFDPSQERDENGRWSGGADVEAASARTQGAHQSAHLRHAAHAKEAATSGRPREAKAHRIAAEYHASAAAKISRGDPKAKEESAAARKATSAAFQAGRASTSGANSARVQNQVARAMEEQRQAKLMAIQRGAKASEADRKAKEKASRGGAPTKPGDTIRAAKLVNFKGSRAEYHSGNTVHEAKQVGGRWTLTGNYSYKGK